MQYNFKFKVAASSDFNVYDAKVDGDRVCVTWGTNGLVRYDRDEVQGYLARKDWLVLPEQSVPLAPTVDSAVSLYTLACERYEAAQLELDRAKDAVRDARLALRDALDGEV